MSSVGKPEGEKLELHINIITIGTRGDVQPYIAFGMVLKQAGHSVKIVTSRSFEVFIRENGLDFGEMIERTLSAVLTNQTMYARAREPGTRVRAEHGVERAVEVFQQHLDARQTMAEKAR